MDRHRLLADDMLPALSLMPTITVVGGPDFVLITVYEPKPPKWTTPTHRRRG